jgi:hypothetical protein
VVPDEVGEEVGEVLHEEEGRHGIGHAKPKSPCWGRELERVGTEGSLARVDIQTFQTEVENVDSEKRISREVCVTRDIG